MKLFVLAIFIVLASAQENYDGPEYQNLDASLLVPVSQLPGFWKGRDFSKSFYTPNVRSARVIGGNVVIPNTHPYMVALSIQFPFGVGVCGGTIIGTQAIMTAAHCLLESSATIVIAGAHNRLINEVSQQRRIVNRNRYITHPRYESRTFNHNIAILHTDIAFTLNSEVNIVRLPTQWATELFVGEQARSIGWGRTSHNGPTSDVLREALNNVIDNTGCAGAFGQGIVIAETICVQTQGGTQGACQADEGGPLTVQRPGGGPVQIGITSFFGTNGCVANQPIGYTRVTSYLGWIGENTIPRVATRK